MEKTTFFLTQFSSFNKPYNEIMVTIWKTVTRQYQKKERKQRNIDS